MRTTLNLDDDILPAVRSLAESRSISLGSAVSELVRRSLRPGHLVYPSAEQSGFPVFKVSENARPITLEDVKRGEDEA